MLSFEGGILLLRETVTMLRSRDEIHRGPAVQGDHKIPSLKKQSYHFRNVKPDDKGRNWVTLSHSAHERPSSWEHFWGSFLGKLFVKVNSICSCSV